MRFTGPPELRKFFECWNPVFCVDEGRNVTLATQHLSSTSDREYTVEHTSLKSGIVPDQSHLRSEKVSRI